MKWDSPWGKSYPGWHIECSAMSRRFLGEHFDIHTGGVDHIPVHHENEIAQCKGAFGHNPANFWIHAEFLLVNGGKMSKSLGNVYTIKELNDNGVEALAYKLFCFSSHYRNKLNFTWDGIKASQVSLNRLRNGYLAHKKGNEDVPDSIINEFKEKFHININDDMNLPAALGILWDAIKYEKKSKKIAELIENFDTVFGLDLINSEKYLNVKAEIPEEITQLVEERKIAKSNKDWAKADEIRNAIKEKGFNIKDLPGDKVEIIPVEE